MAGVKIDEQTQTYSYPSSSYTTTGRGTRNTHGPGRDEAHSAASHLSAKGSCAGVERRNMKGDLSVLAASH